MSAHTKTLHAKANGGHTIDNVVKRLRPEYRDEIALVYRTFIIEGAVDPAGAARQYMEQKYGDAAFTFERLPDPRGNRWRMLVEFFRIHLMNARHHFSEWRHRRVSNYRRTHRSA